MSRALFDGKGKEQRHIPHPASNPPEGLLRKSEILQASQASTIASTGHHTWQDVATQYFLLHIKFFSSK